MRSILLLFTCFLSILLHASPKLYYFQFKGCSACRLMEKQVFPDKEVQEAMARFEVIKMDMRDSLDKPLVDFYAVRYAPTFVVTDSNGVELHRFSTQANPADFLYELRSYNTANSSVVLRSKWENGTPLSKREACRLFDLEANDEEFNEPLMEYCLDHMRKQTQLTAEDYNFLLYRGIHSRPMFCISTTDPLFKMFRQYGESLADSVARIDAKNWLVITARHNAIDATSVEELEENIAVLESLKPIPPEVTLKREINQGVYVWTDGRYLIEGTEFRSKLVNGWPLPKKSEMFFYQIDDMDYLKLLCNGLILTDLPGVKNIEVAQMVMAHMFEVCTEKSCLCDLSEYAEDNILSSKQLAQIEAACP